jgi:hypothetical protein
MLRFLTAISLVLACTVNGFAQEPPALLITPSGHYFVVLDSTGKPTLVEIKQVIRIGDVPPVDTPDDPVPPVGSEVTTKVRVWAEEVNQPGGAQALALIYRTIADKVEDGTLKPENAFPAIKQATDQILPTVGDAGKWTPWRTKLGDLITAKLQAGELTHPQHLVKFLRDVGVGLDQSAKEAPALSPEVVTKIVELIVYLLSLFLSADSPSPV